MDIIDQITREQERLIAENYKTTDIFMNDTTLDRVAALAEKKWGVDKKSVYSSILGMTVHITNIYRDGTFRIYVSFESSREF